MNSKCVSLWSFCSSFSCLFFHSTSLSEPSVLGWSPSPVPPVTTVPMSRMFYGPLSSCLVFLPNPHLGCFLLSYSPSWSLDLYQYNDDVRIRLRVGPVKICIVFLGGHQS